MFAQILIATTLMLVIGTACDGECRQDNPPPECSKSYAAQRSARPEDCFGRCGDWDVVVEETGYTRLECAYDPKTHELVGATIGTDVNVYCGDSFHSTWGEGPVECWDDPLECPEITPQ